LAPPDGVGSGLLPETTGEEVVPVGLPLVAESALTGWFATGVAPLEPVEGDEVEPPETSPSPTDGASTDPEPEGAVPAGTGFAQTPPELTPP